MFRNLTPEMFDVAIIVIIILGLAFAAVRLYADLSRPLPTHSSRTNLDDTQERPAVKIDG